jgi:hypothetical protein
MPTTATNTYGNQGIAPLYDSRGARQHHLKFGNSLTIAKGTVIGQITATGLGAAYNNANADGSEVAKGIAAYDFTTDASGVVTLGGGEQGERQQTAPVFMSGYFKTSELTGLDAAGVADLGKLVSGTVADGVLCVTGD